jgi:hypothetical protein
MDETQRSINAASIYGGVGNTMWATNNGAAAAVMTNNMGRGYGNWYNGWGAGPGYSSYGWGRK